MTTDQPDPHTPALRAAGFPAGFLLGAATSAAQIEGAAHEDGRGPSIWDRFCAEPGRIIDGSNVDVACDHVHRYPEDVALMKWLGLKAYRFSLAWPRVQPLGRGAWNDKGFGFYDRLVDSLLQAGIQPHATLYHWDLPAALQDDMLGWQSRDIVPLFADYAAEVARRLGDRLMSIATLNEPWCVATLGHETAQFAPGITSRRAASQVSHHLLLAHGDAIAAMRSRTKAALGIVLNHTPSFPASPTEADRRAARLDDGLNVRWYMDPLFMGAYPADVLQHLGADAPHIEPGDLPRIGRPIDFLGVNFYTRSLISTRQPAPPVPGLQGFTDMGWEVVPEVLTAHLLRLTREYAPPPIYITENGMANADELVDGRVDDAPRIAYLRNHLLALQRAMALGVDVRGYFYWSLLDNFEWNSGYAKRFGLVHTNYATQQRTPKASAHWYRDFIAQHDQVHAGRPAVAELRLDGLVKRFATGAAVVQGVDLQVADGEFVVLVGASGCGKSTTLRMIAGLEEPSGGRVLIDGQDITDLPPAQRGVAMVFQSYALYPHMTVEENMGFGLKMAGMAREQIATRVRQAATTLQLQSLLARRPKELSGGQRQRVAIGRAIVREPKVFLFDEPLSNLDAALRTQMRADLAALHQRLNATVVYVTHDQVEAMTLGSRIAVFNAGRIEQIGAPMELYERPATRFVAGFLGSPHMNFLPASAAAALGAVAPPGAADLGVRPEHLSWAYGDGLGVRLQRIENLGDVALLHTIDEVGGEPIVVKSALAPMQLPAPPCHLVLRADPRRVLFFDSAGRALAT